VTLDQFVVLCKAYRDLGHAVGDQLDTALDGRHDDCNSNALRMLRRWLEDVERVSGNDEEFGGEVSQALVELTDALTRMERGERL
jgi:hypothetical protein